MILGIEAADDAVGVRGEAHSKEARCLDHIELVLGRRSLERVA